jgi:hypothetical protein
MSRVRFIETLGLSTLALVAWSGAFVGTSAAAEIPAASAAHGSRTVAVRQVADMKPAAAAEVKKADDDGWYRRYLGDHGAPNPGGPVNWYPVNPPYRHVPCFGAPSASFYPGGRFGRWDANGNWGHWGGEGLPGYNGYTGW